MPIGALTSTLQDVSEAIGLYKDNVLIRTRDKIKNMFDVVYNEKNANGKTAIEQAIIDNKLRHADIADRKIGGETYNPEFARLHKAVQDGFVNAGRPDLARVFKTQVPVYDQFNHSTAPVSELLAAAPDKELAVTPISNQGILATPVVQTQTPSDPIGEKIGKAISGPLAKTKVGQFAQSAYDLYNQAKSGALGSAGGNVPPPAPGDDKTPAWLWPVIIFVGLILLAGGGLKKIFG